MLMMLKYSYSRVISLTALFLFINSTDIAQTKAYYPDPDPEIQQRLEEWQDLKFGLLMHWGTYSQWGIVESWSICPEDLGWATGARKPGVADSYAGYVKAYEALQTTFNPVQFNPEKWAAAAKDAGMKYMIFTTKHHDGFCMFDSKYTNYKITDSVCPFSTNLRSNVAKEVFAAFRTKGLWTGAYFSKPDWHSDYYWWKQFPPVDRNCNYDIAHYPAQWKQFVDYTHNQVNELMTDYGKIDVLWLDGGWVRPKTKAELAENLTDTIDGIRWARNPQSQDIDMPRLVQEARAKQPNLLVVDREVPGPQQNFLTPEQHIPETGLPYPWETCMTMATSWSYKPGDAYKTSAEIIHNLVDIVSKGGNYLLNIGPRPDGEWDTTAYSRLKEIGAWLKRNGEAIYGTRKYSRFGEGDSIRYTQSKDGKTVYIFLMKPLQKMLVLQNLFLSSGDTLQWLATGKKVNWQTTTQGIQINLPATNYSTSSPVWVMKLQKK